MALAALCVACPSGCVPDASPTPGLVVAIESDPESLDPRFGTDAGTARLADLLHVGLTRAGPHGERLPALATRWESPDPTTVVFHLRNDVRFVDGTPVRAADVAATYTAVADPALASPRRAGLAGVVRVEAPDDRTVVVRLAAPDTPFLDATGLAILPAATAGARGEVTVGAGPYRLVEARRGDRIVLAPNPHFADGPPRIDPLVLRVVPDPVSRVLELERGTVGLVQELFEPEVLERLRDDPSLRVREAPGSSVAYLLLNFRDPRLRQRRVRRAIALALDREALVRALLGGAARPASGLLAPEHWAYALAPTPRHDPRRARRLLDRAGFPDPDGAGPAPRFRLQYKTTSQPARRRLAEAVQAELADVGIAVDVRTYEWGTLFADVRAANFEVAALTWVGIGDPDLYRLAFHSRMAPPAGYNRGGYASAVMDRLTDAGRRALDAGPRRVVYARIQRRAAHDLPVIPLWWEDRVVVETARLEGFEPEPSGALDGVARAWMR